MCLFRSKLHRVQREVLPDKWGSNPLDTIHNLHFIIPRRRKVHIKPGSKTENNEHCEAWGVGIRETRISETVLKFYFDFTGRSSSQDFKGHHLSFPCLKSPATWLHWVSLNSSVRKEERKNLSPCQLHCSKGWGGCQNPSQYIHYFGRAWNNLHGTIHHH